MNMVWINFGNNIKRRFDIKKKFENLNPADYYKGKMHPADSNSGSNNNFSPGIVTGKQIGRAHV